MKLRPRLKPTPKYLALAEKAASTISEDYLRRGRRIQQLSDGGADALEAARRLADEIGSLFGPQAVCDIFENIAHLWRQRLPEQSGKHRGAHDSLRDAALLWFFNEDDPKSPISSARRGELPKGNGEFYKPMNRTELATIMVNNEGRQLWGAQSSSQLLRRLKYLRAQQRTK